MATDKTENEDEITNDNDDEDENISEDESDVEAEGSEDDGEDDGGEGDSADDDDGGSDDEDAGGGDNDDGQDDEETDDPKILKERLKVATEKADRYKAERDRLKGGKKPSKKGNEAQVEAGSEEYPTLYLVAAGYKDPTERKEIISAAKRMGVSIEDAEQDEYVQAKISRMRKTRSSQRAAGRPSDRSGTVKKDVDWYIRNNKVPRDPKLAAERSERLAQMAAESH